jgi:hypothetical protein
MALLDQDLWKIISLFSTADRIRFKPLPAIAVFWVVPAGFSKMKRKTSKAILVSFTFQRYNDAYNGYR